MNGDGLMFVQERWDELIRHTIEHLTLAGVSTGIAILIGIPLGVLAHKIKALQTPLLMATGVMQTIPSLAMLVMLLALFGKIGVLPAVVALVLYALLPIVRNTVTGLGELSPEINEAARGMGMTPLQELWMVRLPIAFPVILAGIRTAAVIGIGVATLGAFIGAGGLGQFILRGLYTSDTRLILLGAIPSALLALGVDWVLAAFGWGLQAKRSRRQWAKRLRPLALGLPVGLLILILGGYLWMEGSAQSAGRIRIGTKAFTEQLILGELIAQVIEANTNLVVERKFNLGGTMICHEALIRGEIDIYPEYTGTALMAILKREQMADAGQVYRTVAEAYRRQFDVVWLKPLGFNNTYVMTVTQADALHHGWETVSDLAPFASNLRAGFHAEFVERPDGYLRFVDFYGFRFGETRDIDSSLMYQALAKGEVDVISGYSTDGRIAAYQLKMLKDDKQFFPPYEAVPLIRGSVLQAHPELEGVINSLGGQMDEATMQQLSFEVDEEHRPIAQVVRDFLISRNLVPDR